MALARAVPPAGEELAQLRAALRAAQEGERAAQEEARAAKAQFLSLTERLTSMGLGYGGGGGGRRGAHSGAPLPAIRCTPLYSPTSSQAKCFLACSFTGFLCAPATLPHDPAVAAVFTTLLARAGGDTRKLMQEGSFYASASSHLPAFACRVAHEGGAMAAQALFSSAGLCSAAWRFTGASQPELHVRAATSPARPFRPAFNGEVKSAGDGLALEQAAYYTAMDMVRVFFPAEDAVTPCRERRFFHTPPLGFALVGYPHVAYLIALEWVGRLLVSPLSQPFLLESPQHAAAVAALPDQVYAPPLVLSAEEVAAEDWQQPSEEEEEEAAAARGRVCWRVSQGRFHKLVRGNARTAVQFARMARAYRALQRLDQATVGAARPAALAGLTGLCLLFGSHEVLVRMVALEGRQCSDEEVVGGGGVTEQVAEAVAWLAARGVLYTDLRGPNVLLQEEEGVAALCDFDDCLVVVEGGVRTLAAFKAALGAWAREEGLMSGFAVSFAGGAFPQLEAKLEAAFERQGRVL